MEVIKGTGGENAKANEQKARPGEKDQQFKRIEQMEKYLDEATEAVKNVSRALEDFMEAQNKIIALEHYYEGECWRKDREDDEAGELPSYLSRGVLTEDAIYDLLTDNDELLEIISMDQFEKLW